ncbi:MAG TPA: DUF2235 domain-containing protein, partial [Burkholderiales bacterium]|nr:DUF2235 domain-containing protein [Burkholderiales bacterium]
VENYRSGDKLFLFGFSRGAYSARSLAGMIRNSGVLHRSEIARAREAYEIYRDCNLVDSPQAQEFRRQYSHEIEIEFIGVWDTVGALGIPINGIALPGFKNYYQFHNTTLSSRVRGAYQALALNELRAPYSPCVWTLDPGESRSLPVEQRWFLGAHSNVGGGYGGDTLCNPSCRWMQAMAQAHGLRFVSEWKVDRADYEMLPRDSYTEFLAEHPDAQKFTAKQVRTVGLGVNETIDPVAKQLIAEKPTMFNTYTQSFREGVRRLRVGLG